MWERETSRGAESDQDSPGVTRATEYRPVDQKHTNIYRRTTLRALKAHLDRIKALKNLDAVRSATSDFVDRLPQVIEEITWQVWCEREVRRIEARGGIAYTRELRGQVALFVGAAAQEVAA